MARFEARASDDAGRTIVALFGECDMAVRDELALALGDAVDRSREVVVDLAQLHFIDSSGLNGLVAAHHAARERHGHLYVVNATGMVADVLALTGLNGLLAPPLAPGRAAGDGAHA